MLPAARMLDTVVGICSSHPPSPIPAVGMIYPSQSTILINGLPAARMMDIVITGCGHTGIIISGTPTVLINGLPAASLMGTVVGSFTGTIINGSSNVFV
jgi:uncharacterized Zn-binding protein involved in type VI secretion